MGKSSPSVPKSPTDKAQGRILENLENQIGQPIRNTIMPGAMQTLAGPGIYQTSLAAPDRQAIEGQFKQAQNSIMNSGTRGGQLQSQLAQLSRDRAATVSGATNQAKQVGIERAMGLIPAAIPNAQSTMSARGQLGANEQARLGANAKMEMENQAAKGQGIGSLASAGMLAMAMA